MNNWCTIECNPIIFNQIIKEYGVQDLELMDLYDLDYSSF